MRLLSHTLKRALDLKLYTKADRKRILQSALAHLLGLQKYMATMNALREFDCNREFSRFLRMLTCKEYEYVVKDIRPYALAISKGKKPKNNLSPSDRRVIKAFQLELPYKKINKVTSYPDLTVVCTNMRPTLIKKAKAFYGFLHSDRSLDVADIISDLNVKVVEAYGLYILRLGVDGFNEKMLYKCIHNSINTKVIDMSRRANCPRFVGHLKSQTYIETDFEEAATND